jgi:hypothetical protein
MTRPSGDHASFMRIDDGVATSREDHRWPRSGRAGEHRRSGRTVGGSHNPRQHEATHFRLWPARRAA